MRLITASLGTRMRLIPVSLGLRFILDFEHGVGDPNEVDYSLARAPRRRRHQVSVSSDPSGGLVRGLFNTREASLPPCSAMPINVPGQSEPQPLSKVAGPVVRDIGGRRRPWRALRTGYSIDGGAAGESHPLVARFDSRCRPRPLPWWELSRSVVRVRTAIRLALGDSILPSRCHAEGLQ